jgi:hypothetical protein
VSEIDKTLARQLNGCGVEWMRVHQELETERQTVKFEYRVSFTLIKGYR